MVNIWGNHPSLRTLLNLIYKLICRYDFGGNTEALLEWAKPRTRKFKEIHGFGKDWADSRAFLGLYDSVFPGEIPDSGDEADNLVRVFNGFQDKLGVVQLLTPLDLLNGDPDSNLVRMYVAAIKRAIDTQFDEAGDKLAEAEDLFNKANALAARYRTITKDECETVYNDFSFKIQEIQLDEDDREVGDLMSSSLVTMYEPAEERFREVHELYEQCIETFRSIDGNPHEDRVEEVIKKMKEADDIPVTYRTELADKLTKLVSKWRILAHIREGDYVVNDICDELDTYVEKLQDHIVENLHPGMSEQQLHAVLNEAMDLLEYKADPHFEYASTHYDKAKDLCDQTTEEYYHKATRHQKNADDRYDEYREALRIRYSSRIEEIMIDIEASKDKAVEMYHQFARTCAETIRCLQPSGQIEVCGPDPLRKKGEAKDYLEQLLRVVQMSYDRDCALRKELHIGVDGLLDAETMPL